MRLQPGTFLPLIVPSVPTNSVNVASALISIFYAPSHGCQYDKKHEKRASYRSFNTV
jgi:hypothetical protein